MVYEFELVSLQNHTIPLLLSQIYISVAQICVPDCLLISYFSQMVKLVVITNTSLTSNGANLLYMIMYKTVLLYCLRLCCYNFYVLLITTDLEMRLFKKNNVWQHKNMCTLILFLVRGCPGSGTTSITSKIII